MLCACAGPANARAIRRTAPQDRAITFKEALITLATCVVSLQIDLPQSLPSASAYGASCSLCEK